MPTFIDGSCGDDEWRRDMEPAACHGFVASEFGVGHFGMILATDRRSLCGKGGSGLDNACGRERSAVPQWRDRFNVILASSVEAT
jgi:hypothetical protein